MRLQLQGKVAWSQPVIMECLSERYGWTPGQIREMYVEDVLQYLEVISEIKKLERHRQMKNK